MEGRTVLLLFVLIVLVFPLTYMLFSENKPPSDIEKFSICLKEEGVVLACNEYSDECKEQKELFGDGFKHLDYRNCDFSKDFCQTNQITKFPAWIFKGGIKEYGVLAPVEFAKWSKCGMNLTI